LTQSIIFSILIAIGFVLLTIAVIYIEEAKRNIPVQYTKRVASSAQSAVLPLKVNSAGVIPVIFASSFLMTPQIILGYFAQSQGSEGWYKVLSSIFNLQEPLGALLYTVLIVVFTYFYAFIQVNPETAAENLQKQGGYIPSVRPGKATEDYISKLLVRLSTVGAIYLAFISILPIILSAVLDLPGSVALGGTSLLIVVGVALESVQELEGLLSKRNYQGFIQ